jgi:hypothetical protein
VLSQGQHRTAACNIVHRSQLNDHGWESISQLSRHPTPRQPGHERPRFVHEPLVRRSGQGHAGQEHEVPRKHSALMISA